MKDAIKILLAVVAAIFAIYNYYKYATVPYVEGGNNDATHLYLAIAGAIVAFICGLLFFVGRVNKEEEIHITQQ